MKSCGERACHRNAFDAIPFQQNRLFSARDISAAFFRLGP